MTSPPSPSIQEIQRCLRYVLSHALLLLLPLISVALLIGYFINQTPPQENAGCVAFAGMVAHPAAKWGAERYLKNHGEADRELAEAIAATVGQQLFWLLIIVSLCQFITFVVFG